MVAAPAALAALINALLNGWSWWQDNPGLNITVRAVPWGEFGALRDEAGFILEVSNRARTPNWIRELTCRVDSTPQAITLEPPDFTAREIKPVSFSRAALKLPKQGLPEGTWRIELTVTPVRGRRGVFRFNKKDVLPEF